MSEAFDKVLSEKQGLPPRPEAMDVPRGNGNYEDGYWAYEVDPYISALESEIKKLQLAYGLVLELHACGTENCNEEEAYLKHAEEMMAMGEEHRKLKIEAAASREEIKKLSSRIDSLLASETEAVEAVARMRGVVAEYRNRRGRLDHGRDCRGPAESGVIDDDRCEICIKADAFPAPKSDSLAVEKESK